MHFGVGLSLAALFWLYVALRVQALGFSVSALLLGWLAVSTAWVAVGYLGLGVGVFGKDSRGGRAWWAYLLAGPYMFCVQRTRGLIHRFSSERDWDEVSPGVYVGRIVPREALPADVCTVVDLTAEFREDPAILASLRYHCLPTLDGCAPSHAQLARLVGALVSEPQPIYVHCAAGHGRSALCAAVLLHRLGRGVRVRDIEREMRRVRARIHLTRTQARCARAALDLEP